MEHPQQILQKIKGLQVQYMYKNEKVCSVKPGTHKNLLFGPNKSGKIQGGRILYIYIYIYIICVYIDIYIYCLMFLEYIVNPNNWLCCGGNSL